jgi:hypothetical protein
MGDAALHLDRFEQSAGHKKKQGQGRRKGDRGEKGKLAAGSWRRTMEMKLSVFSQELTAEC